MKKCLVLLFSLSSLSIYAQLVSTVAGVLETPGFNDGVALSARFFNPHGIAADSMGNVYIADRYNHTIRKLSPDGIVTTLAGTPGQTGDTDGQGTLARFNEPWGLCSTPSGIIYIADTRNNKIRKLMPDGEVSTIAGSGNFGTSDGFQQSATFGNPTGIEIDLSGNIYIADHLTHIIRKISPDGWVSTLAGTPYIPGNLDGSGTSAQFWRPYGLTLDLEGNILVADEWNHLIRRISPTGEVVTIAGSGNIGASDGIGTQASFNYPWDVTVSPSGDIYVADGYNYLIRKINPNQEVTSLAGTVQVSGGNDGEGLEASFSGATSITHCRFSNTFYIADAYNHLIRQLIMDEGPQLNLILNDASLVYCEGDTLQAQAIPGNLSFYRFSINGLIVQEGDSPILSLQNIEIGNYQLECISYFEGVEVNSTPMFFNILPNPVPEITVVGPTELLPGDSVTLFANGSGTFLWSTGESGGSIVVTDTGTYSVILTNSIGCTGESELITISSAPVQSIPEILIDGDTILCPGDEVVLVASYAGLIQWFKDGWPIAGATNESLIVSEAAYYQVQITDIGGLSAISAPLSIQLAILPEYDFIATPNTVEQGNTINIEVYGEEMINYDWNINGPISFQRSGANIDQLFNEVGYYDVQLSIITFQGCRDTIFKERYLNITSTPTVDPSPPSPSPPIIMDSFIPTAFTPNGDGLNDSFRPIGDQWNNYQLTIFDQWGNILFEGILPDSAWDGTSNQMQTQAGTYTYLLIPFSAGSSTNAVTAGHITLIR